jgi:hypothetical protein
MTPPSAGPKRNFERSPGSQGTNNFELARERTAFRAIPVDFLQRLPKA